MNLINGTELSRKLAVAGTKPSLTPELGAEDPFLKGRFVIERTLSGIQLHIMDAQELTNSQCSFIAPPGLTFGVVLLGSVRFTVGEEEYHLAPSHTENQTEGENATPLFNNCFALNLLRHTTIARALLKDESVCKIYITVSHKWLEQHLNLSETVDRKIFHFIRQQHGLIQWQGSSQLKALAEEIIHSSQHAGVFSNLSNESEIIKFCAAFLHELKEVHLDIDHLHLDPAPLRGVQSGKSNAERIKQFIDDRLFQSATNLASIRVETIASELGLSTRSMQRIFKQEYAQTVFDYIRQHRLAIARDALINGDVSIGEAAYLAGYKHSSNFANAFKEAFGVAPGNLRSSIKSAHRLEAASHSHELA